MNNRVSLVKAVESGGLPATSDIWSWLHIDRPLWLANVKYCIYILEQKVVLALNHNYN
jgi:hypothetical protein